MKRSKFSLSHYKLLTCDMGELIPIGCMEVLPGDTFQHATSALIRVSPLLSPVMHPVHCRIHHWFVPHRLVWDDWEKFITGGPDGMDASVHPAMHFATGYKPVGPGTLGNYMGLPADNFDTFINALPFRAYNLIWNEHYRDQDLQAEIPIGKASGEDTTTPANILNCAWEKDYFTTARPWTQKGPEVTVPFADTAAVVSTGQNIQLNTLTGGTHTNTPLAVGQITGINALQIGAPGVTGAPQLAFGAQTGLEADLTSASSVNINQLREAFAIQRYEEARARYGSRYTEYLRYLGVKSSDARLQRPEYLGGGKQTIQFSEVLQTGPDTEGAGVADLKGHGIGAMRSNRYRRFFEEHGTVISLLSVKPKTMYANGIPRAFQRGTKEDYFQKELQHIGQQEIYNREVYSTHSEPAGVFGYQDRYDEYRRMESQVSGDFAGTLDHWHYARMFASEPALNGDFIKAVPTKRVNAVQTEDVLWIMANHSIQARRMVAASGRSFIF